MREILFRGKRVDNGEWIKGYYVFQKKRRGTFGQTVSEADFDHGCIVAMSGEMHEVVPDTVGQYTGLTDQKGKKVFEGDIVEYNGTNHRVVFENRFQTAYFGIVMSAMETWGFSNSVPAHMMEVIGNIHDNPELLEGEHNG